MIRLLSCFAVFAFGSLAIAQHCAPVVRSHVVAPATVVQDVAIVTTAVPLVVPVFSYVASPQAAYSQMQQPAPTIDAEKIARALTRT